MTIALVLPLPGEVAVRLALPTSVVGALPAADLHVTVVVLTAAPPDLVGQVAELVTRFAPLAATLSGVGRFAGADGRDAFHATVDAPALPALRACLEARFRDVLDRTHGLDPHVTLAYLAPDAPSPLARMEPMSVALDALAVWDGPARTTFPFAPAAMIDCTILDAVALPDVPPSELRLFRDGWNDTVKGRFLLDAEGAAECLRRFAAHGVELAMDFDHATFVGGAGTKRDVPGYIGALEHRPGDGLYATGIRWTDVGLRAISPGRAPDGSKTLPEYRYWSPAIDFDADTRRVTGIKPVALVSYPATHGQRPLVLSAEASPPDPSTDPEKPPMKNVIALLGLGADATEAQIVTSASALQSDRAALLSALGAKDAAAGVERVARLTAAEAQLAAETKRADDSERGLLVLQGRADGKLTPALEKLYAAKPPAELREFLAAATPNPALARTEPRAQPAKGDLPAPVPGVPDKPFEMLTAMEKHTLLAANPMAFEQRLSVYEARVGAQPRYRALLAG